ncbi:MAG: acyl-CoA dehydrogenase family protein [Sphingobium sp.]
MAQSARAWFIDWAANRVPSNLGAPLSSLYRYQEGLGVIDGLLLSNRVLLESAAHGRLRPGEVPMVKHLVTENAIAAVDRIVSLAGNPGLSRAHPLERHHRDVLCGRVHTPQADVILGGSGRASFGAAAKAATV